MARILVPGAIDPIPTKPDLGVLHELDAQIENVQAVQVGACRAGEPV